MGPETSMASEARNSGTSAQGSPQTIWIIDSEQWPRACLRAELIERGYDAIGFTEIKGALSGLRSRRRKSPNVIVLELRGQKVKREILGALTAIPAPLIVIGGAQELNHPLIKEFAFPTILRRPVTLGSVADVIDAIILSHR